PARRLVVVFQPHLYSRTRDLQAEFAAALSAADAVLLCDIYGARETPEPGVTSALIGGRMTSGVLRWSGPRQEAAAHAYALAGEGDVVLTMGAGDITRTGPELLERLRATASHH
ncbi:MAG: glutamate ligase domain-containing protein, partial [Gemmatimonas sp.]